MPIQFRCDHCGQLLSISRRKAGSEVTCPKCVQRVTVPTPEFESDAAGGEQAEKAEIVTPPTARPELPAEETWDQPANLWDEEEGEEELELSFKREVLHEGGLDMTPMVDVVMLLLIFFMITASFSMQKSLESSPPEPDNDGYGAQALSVEDVEGDSVVVDIDAENNLRVDDVPVAGVRELADILKSKIRTERKNELLIEVHPLATHGTVVAVMDAGLAAQMQKIRRSFKKGDD